jgi:uncharacterized protein
MSVSKVQCRASVRGKGEFTIELYKHLAPVTVNAILEALPIVSRATIYPGAMVTFLTNIRVGVEKARGEFMRGDVAFLPANGSLCIFIASAKSARPLNPVGKIEGGLEALERSAVGDVVQIGTAQEAGAQT